MIQRSMFSWNQWHRDLKIQLWSFNAELSLGCQGDELIQKNIFLQIVVYHPIHTNISQYIQAQEIR